MKDKVKANDTFGASLIVNGVLEERQTVEGHYRFELTDSKGNVLWLEDVKNLIPTVGKGQLWTSGFIGTTVYMGLISSVGYSTIVVADTMASHAGWNEVANTGTNTPPYGTTRPTETFSATTTGVIVSAAALSFVFTNSGTVQGGFMVGGAGATNTVANTGGVLLSAGTLAVARSVLSGDTLNVSYSGTLT